MTITAVQVSDLRADLGDEANAFDDEELTRLLERSRDSNGTERHSVALAMGIFQLLTQAARFASYTVNEAEERRGEIWKALEAAYNLLLTRPDVNEALGSGGTIGAMTTRQMKWQKTSAHADEYGRRWFWGGYFGNH